MKELLFDRLIAFIFLIIFLLLSSFSSYLFGLKIFILLFILPKELEKMESNLT